MTAHSAYRGEYPACVVVKLIPDMFGWTTRIREFYDLDDACRYAFLKGGRVFGLSPEYEYEVTAKALTAVPTTEEENDE